MTATDEGGSRDNGCQRREAAPGDNGCRRSEAAPGDNECQRPRDAVIERARPAFLYVMYALLLWSLPMGWIAAIRPQAAGAMTRGMAAYFAAIPEPLYALFGTGYLGYTVARSWAKARGTER